MIKLGFPHVMHSKMKLFFLFFKMLQRFLFLLLLLLKQQLLFIIKGFYIVTHKYPFLTWKREGRFLFFQQQMNQC